MLHMPSFSALLARSSDHYEDFSCHRWTSQYHSANDTHRCSPPTLATITLPQLHPQPSTAPHSQNARETSTLDPVTTQDPWSNTCPELIEIARKTYTKVIRLKTGLMILSKTKVGYKFIETLNRTVNSLIENNVNTFAMHAVKIFPPHYNAKQSPKTMDPYLKQWQGDVSNGKTEIWMTYITKGRRCKCA